MLSGCYRFFIYKILLIVFFVSITSICTAKSFSIMTWNTGDSDRTFPKACELAEFINQTKKKPDIIIFQEIYHNSYLKLKKNLGYKYGIHSSEISSKIKNLAILSTSELSNHELIVFSNNISGALKTEIKINKRNNLKIYSVHFEYIKQKKRNKNGFVSLKLKEIIDILKKEISLKNPRKLEAKKLLEKTGKPGNATILAGDFNTVSFSSSIRIIKKYYKDAIPFFKKFTSGTYKKIRFPLKPRIDYIFHSPDIFVENFEVIKNTPGDHYPVTATIKY